MLDDLLDIVCCLDWLTPILSLLDPNAGTIALGRDDVWALEELKRQGIRVRRVMFAPGGRLLFDVPLQQAGLAKLKLKQLGFDMRDGPGRPWQRRKKS